jgi:hypothetical protein
MQERAQARFCYPFLRRAEIATCPGEIGPARDERLRNALAALVTVAEQMIAGTVGPIEGSRRIAQHRFGVGDEDNAALMPFVGIASESDNIVVGDRALWAAAFLEEIDRAYEEYEVQLRSAIAADCRALLDVFAPRLRFWIALDEGPRSK